MWVLQIFFTHLVGGFLIPIKGNLVPNGFYPLDGISGINDTSSCRNPPGIADGTSLAPGYIGEPDTAYKFGGNISSFVRLPNNATIYTESITLIAWFNTETLTSQQTLMQLSSEGKMSLLLALYSDKLNITMYPNCDQDPKSLFASFTFKISTWYFLAVSYDYVAGSVKVRIRETDGTQTVKDLWVGHIELETYHAIWLGYGPDSPGAFNGSIACVQIYNKSLSLNEITLAQKMCLPKQWSEPFALYALDDKNLIQDTSGNSNPSGTAYNVNEKDGPNPGTTSIHFDDAPDSYISIPHIGELLMDTSFSIVAWIYKDPYDGYEGHIATFGKDDQSFSGLEFKGTWSTNKIVGKLYLPSSDKIEVVGDVYANYFYTGNWQHIALVYNYDTGYARLYFDSYVYETFVGSHTVGASDEIIVGKSYLGRIACLQIYHRPLLLEHVEDAKDKCYQGIPDPPLCLPPSHVTKPCTTSSSVMSSLSSLSSISMDSTHKSSLTSVSESISESSLSTTLEYSSTVTETVSQTQETISTSTTATATSILTTSVSNSDIQPSSTIESSLVWTKSVSDSQQTVSRSALSDSIEVMSSTCDSSDFKTATPSLQTSKPTPIMTGTSYWMTLRTLPDSHVTGSNTKTVVPSQPLTETAPSSTVNQGYERVTNLTQWSAWSSCSKPCGTGQQSRVRHCNKTVIEDCVGEGTESRECNVDACEVAAFNVTVILLERPWNDSLLLKDSTSFSALEDALRQAIKELYTTDAVNVTLLSCRRGSVIVHYSVEFEAVDSAQVVKLADGMEIDGQLPGLGSVQLVNMTSNNVPNQTPTKVKAYLTSSTSVGVSWKAVDEPIDGYHVAFRSTRDEKWKNVYTSAQTLSLHLENLIKGDTYRLRVAAFNSAGNGIPSEATKIHIKEGVPVKAPEVSVSDVKTISSLTISWTAIPDEHVKGKLLGYHITYKPIKIAEQHVNEAETITVTVSANGRRELSLGSLTAFTQYSITVAGFTAVGDGRVSMAVIGETCVCPKMLYTNWALYPPYVTEVNQQPAGIIGELIQEMILSSCGICTGGHGETILDITNNGKGDTAKKNSMGGVGSDVDDNTHISFPIIGNMDDEKYLKEFVFVPVVKSPGIAFISLANKPSRAKVAELAWDKTWPVVVLSLLMAFISAVFVWIVERREKTENFPKSFLRGTGDLIWHSLMSMTTVGYGDKVPVRVVSKLITIVWILIGLVLISIFVAALTVALTVMTTENQIILYGTEVTALKDSPSHRLGILRNARVAPKETLEEAFEALQNKETEGVLLDAYVAGSGVSNFMNTPYRVNKVIETKKGLGIVLSGEAMVLRYRVRDFVRKNAKRITEIIQNSTTPIEQPEVSEAEEQAQGLMNVKSESFRSAITVSASALGASFLIGVAWELFRKKHQNCAKGQSKKLYKSQKAEIAEVLEEFHSNFTQAYSRLRDKHKRQLKMYQALAKKQQECLPKRRAYVVTEKK